MPRGGPRVGAGRPKKGHEKTKQEKRAVAAVEKAAPRSHRFKTAKEFILNAINDEECPWQVRGRLAEALLKTECPPADQGGKKAQRAAAAEKASTGGRFATPPPPPRLATSGGRSVSDD